MSAAADDLRERLSNDGPIYATVSGPEAKPMLTVGYHGEDFLLVMENIDVGGGPAIEVSEALALAWAAQFGKG